MEFGNLDSISQTWKAVCISAHLPGEAPSSHETGRKDWDPKEVTEPLFRVVFLMLCYSFGAFGGGWDGTD